MPVTKFKEMDKGFAGHPDSGLDLTQPTCVPIQGIHKTNTSGYFYRANERNNTLPNNRIYIHISTKLNICQKEKIDTLCMIIRLRSSKKFQ